jgi:hypothetical protein
MESLPGMSAGMTQNPRLLRDVFSVLRRHHLLPDTRSENLLPAAGNSFIEPLNLRMPLLVTQATDPPNHYIPFPFDTDNTNTQGASRSSLRNDLENSYVDSGLGETASYLAAEDDNGKEEGSASRQVNVSPPQHGNLGPRSSSDSPDQLQLELLNEVPAPPLDTLDSLDSFDSLDYEFNVINRDYDFESLNPTDQGGDQGGD